jgi:hypothetical protein
MHLQFPRLLFYRLIILYYIKYTEGKEGIVAIMYLWMSSQAFACLDSLWDNNSFQGFVSTSCSTVV